MKKKEKKTCGEVKAEFSTSSIFLKKIDKDNFEKKTCGETLQQNKNHVEKYCNNPQCFKEKNYEAKSMKFSVVILNQINIKNNKIDKDNFEKNHKKYHVG